MKQRPHTEIRGAGAGPLIANRPAPLFAKEKTAAKLLEMTLAEFSSLWRSGVLPPPVDIYGHKRWRVSDLEAIADGTAMDGEFEV